jgi:hypothetical protein
MNGLRYEGADLADADVIVGTSAGAIAGMTATPSPARAGSSLAGAFVVMLLTRGPS